MFPESGLGESGLAEVVEAFDHDVGGFDEGGGGVAFFELKLADGVGRNDGGDVGVADGEDDFGEQAFDADADDLAGELVAAADLAIAFARLGSGFGLVFGEEWLQGGFRDAVMAAGGLDGLELAREDPLFDGGVADAQKAGGFAWRQQMGGSGHGSGKQVYQESGDSLRERRSQRLEHSLSGESVQLRTKCGDSSLRSE